MNAPLPFKIVEPTEDPRVSHVVNVLAGYADSDQDWLDADGWTGRLEESDFFTELTPKMMRQILELIARNRGTVYSDVFNHLTDTIRAIQQEDE